MSDVLSGLIIWYKTVKICYTFVPVFGDLGEAGGLYLRVRPSDLVAFPNANIFHECVWRTGMAESMNHFQILNDFKYQTNPRSVCQWTAVMYACR